MQSQQNFKMRKAITIGYDVDGNESVLFGSAVPIEQQKRLVQTRDFPEGVVRAEVWSGAPGVVYDAARIARHEAASKRANEKKDQRNAMISERIRAASAAAKAALAGLVACFVMFAFAPEAQAQDPRYGSATLSGVGTAMPASAVSNFTAVTIDVRKFKDVGLQASLNLGTADPGASNVIFTLVRSVDTTAGTTGAGATVHSWTIAPNGTNTVTVSTNFAVGAAGWLQLRTINNNSTAAVANLSIKYSNKMNAE
jgi:hypothetical protein